MILAEIDETSVVVLAETTSTFEEEAREETKKKKQRDYNHNTNLNASSLMKKCERNHLSCHKKNDRTERQKKSKKKTVAMVVLGVSPL